MTQIEPQNSLRGNLLEHFAKPSVRWFWFRCAAGLMLLIGAVAIESPDRAAAELLLVFGLVLIVFGPTKLADLGKALRDALDHIDKGSGGFGPPGVPVESALCVLVRSKGKEPEPPLPPL